MLKLKFYNKNNSKNFTDGIWCLKILRTVLYWCETTLYTYEAFYTISIIYSRTKFV